MYQVLARTWRPQSLDELVGQQHVVRTLRNALASGRLAHAYVFAGVRGTGKTTVARILAKSLNCETGPTATPCNRCVSCVEITEGRAIDVMELDAASRTGVDNIRELQEIVAYAPVRDRNKILIIDEAHMLSKAAFNALLKTLEEPPPNVVFMLATTEMQKLLPTILSRCQVFEFRRLSVREVSGHLRRVSDAEGIQISERTLDAIARAGDGSVRDALSVLERVLAFCGATVSDEDAGQVLGTVRLEALDGFVRAIAARDAAALLAALDGVVDEGHDLVHFWGELVAVVRDLMLLRAWPEAGDILSRAHEEAVALSKSGSALSLEDWTRVFQILAGLEHGLKTSTQPRFLFEGALIRIASLHNLQPISEILSSLREATPGAVQPPVRSDPRPQPPPKKKEPGRAAASPVAPSPRGPSPAALGLDELRTLVIDSIAAVRPMLGVVFEEAASIVLDGSSLVATFRAGGDGMRRMLASEDNTKAIEGIVGKALGRPVTLRLASEAERADAAARGGAPAARDAGEESRPTLLDRASKDPVVRRLIDEFGARIVDVRPAVEPPVAEPMGATPEETA